MAGNEEKNYIDELVLDIVERFGGYLGNDIDRGHYYALLALTKGTRTTIKDVDHAWKVWAVRIGHDVLDAPRDQIEMEHRAIIAAVESKLHREARADMDKPKSSSRSPEQARPGD